MVNDDDILAVARTAERNIENKAYLADGRSEFDAIIARRIIQAAIEDVVARDRDDRMVSHN